MSAGHSIVEGSASLSSAGEIKDITLYTLCMCLCACVHACVCVCVCVYNTCNAVMQWVNINLNKVSLPYWFVDQTRVQAGRVEGSFNNSRIAITEGDPGLNNFDIAACVNHQLQTIHLIILCRQRQQH